VLVMVLSSPLAELLRRHRAEAHLTQEELAERAGVSARAIGDIETGVSLWPRAITVSLIAEALGLDAESKNALRSASTRRALGSSADLPRATTLIGRDTEMGAVLMLLRDDPVKLVTLTGGPGVGKTALAVAAASELAPEFDGRARFIDFTALPDAALVPTKIALALGVRDANGESIAASLARAIGDRPMLLVLDNFERIAAAAAHFVAELLAGAPRLKLLVTSRTPLHLTAEHVLNLAVLTTESSEAMLLERVRSTSSEPVLSADDAAGFATLMRTLGGVPLAIELAAPLLRTSSPAELADRLEHPLDVLVADGRRRSQRQHTMRDAIARSYALLTNKEQRLFRKLAVFGGSFTDDAVQQIASEDGSSSDTFDTLRALATLVDQSLVMVSDEGAEDAEFEIHAFVGEFAAELLEQAGESEDTYLQLAEYCMNVAQRPPRYEPLQDRATRARLNRESANFDGALGRLKSTGRVDRALALAIALWPIWYRRGANAHGYAWVSSLLSAGENARSLDNELVANAHWAASGLAMASGQLDQAEQHIAMALPLKRALSDRDAIASLLAGAGVCASWRGHDCAARKFFEEGLAIRRELGDGLNVARSLLDLGAHLSDEGEFSEATRHLDEALSLFRAAGRKMGMSLALGNLGLVAVRSGSPAQAEPLAREAVSLAEAIGFPESARAAKMVLSRALLESGDVDQAEAFALSVAAADEESAPAMPGDIARLLAAMESERGRPRLAARFLGAATSPRNAVIPPADRVSHERLVARIFASLGSELDVEREIGRERGGRAILADRECRE
jgi:predicted ATPase/transcriptional regulator with XRE-family HTH domain/Tfp pilus assembly protein PilF